MLASGFIGRRLPRGMAPHVVSLGSALSDTDIVEALRSRARWAPSALYDRHGPYIDRLLRRLVGTRSNGDLDDLFQEVFAVAFRSIDRLREPERLKAWLSQIAVLRVRQYLRSKRRRRWLSFFSPADLPERADSADPSDDAREALAHAHALLEKLPVEERIAFSLHKLSNLELSDVALACGVSLATIKRRIGRAERTMLLEAENDPTLCPWLAPEEDQP
jgi:RNA polymerase sigma-70 factor, ECF subfamily